MKNTITEMKNILEGITSRINEAEEWISELEDTVVEITGVEQNKQKRMKRNVDSLRDLRDNIKLTNICLIGVAEGEEEKGPETIFEEIIAENFPTWGRKQYIKSRKCGESHMGQTHREIYHKTL